jgi:flagellar M-ring protein FliF
VNRLNQLGARARTLLAGFTPGQRGVILVAVLALVLGTVALGRWAAQPSWTPLFSGLSATDTSAIIDQLKNQNVPYQLTNGGNTILVPQEQVYDLRISMAAKGLTNSNDSSWSVLDQQGMTATDFQQNVAYQRALESELAKTLQAIGGVNTAIVHLAIPKKDVFTTDTEHPTASVLLALAPGTTLGRAQIRAVMHLVAGSVPGLSPSDVTVTDANGNLMSVPEDGLAGAVGAASDADQQTQAFEDSKSAALQKLLDGVLGPGKAVVRVNAELNYDATKTTSELYVTQSGIPPLSRATSSESYAAGVGAAGGALGQTYPSLTPGLAGGAGGGTYIHVMGTEDPAVGKVVTNTDAAPGSVKRMTVAVALDAKAAALLNPAQVAQIPQLVSTAIGINTTRGDSVTVSQIPFDTTAAAASAKELAAAQSAARTAQYIDLGEKAGLALLAVIFFVVMMRRSRKNTPALQVEAVASDLPPGLGGPTMLPGLLEEQLAISAGGRDVMSGEDIVDPSLERELLRNEVSKFVDQQPEEIAIIVQSWLGQRKG